MGACSATQWPQPGMTRACTLLAVSFMVLEGPSSRLSAPSNFRFGDAADVSHPVTTPDADDEVLAAFEAAGVHLTLI